MTNLDYTEKLALDDMLANALPDEPVSNWEPVAVIEPNYSSSIDILKLFKAPWVLCWLGRGDRLLDYLARNSDIVGRSSVIKNKHLSSKLIHSIVTGDYGFSTVEYNYLSSHPNIDPYDVAYLLMSEKTAFGVQFFSRNYIKGLHFLRDSGVKTDFDAYCKLGLQSSTFSTKNNPKLELELEDVRNFLASNQEDEYRSSKGSLSWKQKELVDSIIETDDRFEVLMEVVSCSKALPKQREKAYAIVRESPEFLFADMPEEWARKASGMLPAAK